MPINESVYELHSNTMEGRIKSESQAPILMFSANSVVLSQNPLLEFLAAQQYKKYQLIIFD